MSTRKDIDFEAAQVMLAASQQVLDADLQGALLACRGKIFDLYKFPLKIAEKEEELSILRLERRELERAWTPPPAKQLELFPCDGALQAEAKASCELDRDQTQTAEEPDGSEVEEFKPDDGVGWNAMAHAERLARALAEKVQAGQARAVSLDLVQKEFQVIVKADLERIWERAVQAGVITRDGRRWAVAPVPPGEEEAPQWALFRTISELKEPATVTP